MRRSGIGSGIGIGIGRAATWALLVAAVATARGDDTGPAPGYAPADLAAVPSFTSNDKIMMTYYFYWYDEPTKSHIVDPDGTDALTTHPARLEGTSYRSVAWHRRQLEDMIAAGIDVVLPVYWGAPSERDPKAGLHWSFEGLGPFVRARDELVAEGKRPPRVGLFYDTSTLQYNSAGYHADLTTERGRAWFGESIRDFFARIPPRHWAQIDGQPIVGLYAAAFAKAHDQRAIDAMRADFARDFGGKTPYLIREVSWNVASENVYAWGGAIRPSVLGVAEIGPGYDHAAVPGRTPLVAPREGGAHYERAWQKAIRAGAKVVIVETWNEWHEGTDVADSREYGRTYIDLTRLYADRWKSGWTPPPVVGPHSGASSVAITFGAPDAPAGLARVEAEDGRTTAATVAGRAARIVAPGGYLYVVVDDSFKGTPAMDATVEVAYVDGPAGALALHYDSHDAGATLRGAYKAAAPGRIRLGGTNAWKTATFRLPGARFAGLQNGGADFRLAVEGPAGVAVSGITLRRWSDTGSR
jgi:hypothetical protein